MTDQDVAERLAPLLSVSMPVRKDLIDRAWRALGGLLSLKPNESAFVDAVQREELKPELLFPDNQDEAGRLAAHPAILWKIQNVGSYLARPAVHRKGSGSAKRRK